MEDNFIQIATSAGHAVVAYTIGSIFIIYIYEALSKKFLASL